MYNKEKHSTGLVKKALEEPLHWTDFFHKPIVVGCLLHTTDCSSKEKMKGPTDIYKYRFRHSCTRAHVRMHTRARTQTISGLLGETYCVILMISCII